MSAKKTTTKGKRYTPEEKQKIVTFAQEHNVQNKRGGASAAAKKFGVSQISIGAWLKSGKTSTKSSKVKTPRISVGSRTTSDRSSTLTELVKLDGVIAAKRKELGALEERFEKLKSSL